MTESGYFIFNQPIQLMVKYLAMARSINSFYTCIKYTCCRLAIVSAFCSLVFWGGQIHAQLPYTIDISQQAYSVKTNFIKTGSNRAPDGDVLSYNSLYLTRNGKPWFPVMGEMHYSQNNEEDWESTILKMKAGGVEIISVYVFWIHHEETEWQQDWSGKRDLRRFLSLCRKHDMYVWLRPGPWIHAEARNGGFPDWLQHQPIKHRTNDSNYLIYVQKWFCNIAKQCEGYWYKQNGTVIGVQIENELEFKAPAAYDHMKKLKHLAISAGMDVPYYSAFAQGPDNQDEFFYTLGGYPDSPWGQHTHKLFKPVFFIKPLEADSDIGADLFGRVDTKVRNTYPKLGAELGSGMQVTYHRRVQVSAKDIGATSFTRVASGLNGMGYFMYTGGHNPIGKTTMNESRVTGYPNDLPLINYDFQAPIGDMGVIRESYQELRLINLFLQDFGEQLATQKSFFPKESVRSYFSYDTVQTAIRVHNNSGFIFLDNYQRFVDLPAVNNFQLHLLNKNDESHIPEKPIRFNANSYTIWPYNLNMNGITLQYATAQPFCILRSKQRDTYVFFTDTDAEFVFARKGLVQYRVGKSIMTSDKEKIHFRISKDRIGSFEIKTNEKSIHVLVLSRQMALESSKIKYKGRDVLVWSKDPITTDGNVLMLEHVGENPFTTLSIYPKMRLLATDNTFAVNAVKGLSLFANYQIKANRPYILKTHVDIDSLSNNDSASVTNATKYQDSILQYYATSKRFNLLQPGPVYQPLFHPLPGQQLYQVLFKAPVNNLIRDWLATIHYEGDVMAMYKNDSLLYDQFNYNNNCLYKLSSAKLKQQDKLVLQILPVKKEYDIYTEDDMTQSKNNEWRKAALKSIELKPVYVFSLK
jgi:beta-galactosidase